jgi:hypothetical protein
MGRESKCAEDVEVRIASFRSITFTYVDNVLGKYPTQWASIG